MQLLPLRICCYGSNALLWHQCSYGSSSVAVVATVQLLRPQFGCCGSSTAGTAPMQLLWLQCRYCGSSAAVVVPIQLYWLECSCCGSGSAVVAPLQLLCPQCSYCADASTTVELPVLHLMFQQYTLQNVWKFVFQVSVVILKCSLSKI